MTTTPCPEFTALARERFWAHVEKSGDCWTWTAYISPQGYGQVRSGGVGYQAHRLAYLMEVGPVPEGLDLDHLCRNRACVNPDHLEPVTRSENTRRGVLGFELTGTCRSGRHAIESDADYATRTNGRRTCRACARESWHRRYGVDRISA